MGVKLMTEEDAEAVPTVLRDESAIGMRRVIDLEEVSEDVFQSSLRPQRLADYVGQRRVCDHLDIAISAAKRRGESMDHVLFHGPPGLGKTTLAMVIARELGVGLKATSGPVMEKAGDLAAILTGLQPRDVLFIDEIHRLSRVVEEILYSAMEDFQIDIIIGEGPAARSVKVDLAPFTLVGATTRTGMLTAPLRDRFGIIERMEFYDSSDLKVIVQRSAMILGVGIDEAGADEIARRSRGTPRIANRLLKRVRDYAQQRADGLISATVADSALKLLDVDHAGLDRMDQLLLETLIETFSGGPVGLETMAAALSEDKDTIEDVYEPFLIQRGFLQRTPRGRVATRLAYNHLGKNPPINTLF